MNHYLWKLRPYFRQVAGELLLGSISGILMNTMVVFPAVLLGRAIDITLAFEKGQANLNQVAWAALAFFLGTLANQIPRLGKRWWLMTANARILANIRADALRGVLNWPMEKVHTNSIGDLMSRIVGDVQVLGVGIHDFTVETWDTVLFTISVIAAMLIYSPRLSLLALAPALLAILLAQLTGRWVREKTSTAREANGKLTAALQDQLAGIRVLKLFGRTSAAAERIETLSQDVAHKNFEVVRLQEGLQPIYTLLSYIGVFLVIAIGGQQVIAGSMTIGAFVAYMELFLRFTSRGYRLPRMLNTIQAGGVAYSRLEPVLAPALPVAAEPPYASFRPDQVCGPKKSIPVPPPAHQGPAAVRLNRVTFRYPGAARPAISDASFEIPAGSFIAITGPVGCGKSALLRAILGLYSLEQGEIFMDGESLTHIFPEERTGRISYLRQDPYLFSGAIRENIVFGSKDTACIDRISDAVQTAILGPDLQRFPDGIETQIGEGGSRVSGGQRQRIAMARSLAATPATPGLLLLDDPFSAVDLDTEARLITSLLGAFGRGAPPERRATILLSSHRLAAFPLADRIIVLDQGHIHESGTHDELLASGGLYASIYQSQVANPVPGPRQTALPYSIIRGRDQ